MGTFPFDEARLPLPQQNAFSLYERFLGHLIVKAPDCVDYVDGRGALLSLEYLTRTGGLHEASQEYRSQISENLSDVSFTLNGGIIEGPDGLEAVFGVTDFRSSRAVSRVRFAIPEIYRERACGAGALPVTTALKRLATRFADRLSDLQRIVVLGGYLAETDAQTSFGRYLEHELTDALSRSVESPITDRTLGILHIRDQGHTRLRSISGRGITLTPREFEVAAVDTLAVPVNEPGSYRMSFRYWLCEGDRTARLSVTLQGQQGRSFTEFTNISLNNLPAGLDLRPANPNTISDWEPEGAFAFQMTSQRGPNPVFRAGEKLEVLFRTGRDTWLYCFYTNSEGHTVQLLPNPFQQDQPKAHFYTGGRAHLFPDPERQPRPDPFDIMITDDTVGTEVFRCIASPRDLRNDLPSELRGTSLEPISPRYITRLREIFEQLEGGTIAEARMTVTVLE
ncbi:MAG: DUF4384 domain-containing protein [Natronohydrobacter sp.]|nr:DUF4384 domain-containing protein [Natronohydrobacter sp.]